jgi:hypothetical protein
MRVRQGEPRWCTHEQAHCGRPASDHYVAPAERRDELTPFDRHTAVLPLFISDEALFT